MSKTQNGRPVASEAAADNTNNLAAKIPRQSGGRQRVRVSGQTVLTALPVPYSYMVRPGATRSTWQAVVECPDCGDQHVVRAPTLARLDGATRAWGHGDGRHRLTLTVPRRLRAVA